MTTVRNHIQHLLGILMVLAIVLSSAPLVGDTVEILTIDNEIPQYAAAKPQEVKELIDTRFKLKEEITAVPYVADVLVGETKAIGAHLAGKDPNAGKTPDEKGQNVRNNVALTLIDLIRDSKAVRNLRFELVPYQNKKNVFEICAFYVPMFGKNEVVFHSGVLHDYNTKTVYRADGTGILGIGYDFNFDFDTFYSSDDPWQRDFGFCRLYDQAAFLIGDLYDTTRVQFTYGGKDWMVQLWKGIYSFNMVGGEIGLYTKPTDRKAAYYDCATDADRMVMSFTISTKDETIVKTTTADKWWQTAFTYHKLIAPGKLTMNGQITFPDQQMAKLFVETLSRTDDTITCKRAGSTVTFTWPATR